MDALCKIITEIAQSKNCRIDERTDLIIDLGYDSLKFIQLISEIENSFNIEFDIDDIEIGNLRSVFMLKQVLENKRLSKNE